MKSIPYSIRPRCAAILTSAAWIVVPKQLALTTTMVLLSCLVSRAVIYNIPITGAASFQLLGSQFIPAETVNSYSTAPQDGDQVLFWDVASQDLDPLISTYSTAVHQWDSNPALPPGMLSRSAFFYIGNGVNTTFTRNIPGLIIPAALPPMAPDLWYALSSQTPVVATYGDLVGVPATQLPAGLLPRTYVMRWDIPAQDFETIWRYAYGQWLRVDLSTLNVTAVAGPLIPQFEGAFVARFTGASCSPAPALQSVQVSGCCAPDVMLTLTFSGDVDIFDAAVPANYVVTGGLVTGVTVQTTHSGPAQIPTVSSVVLTVKLMSQCGNTYTVSAPNVRCKGGTPVTGSQTFSLSGCASVPGNDTSSSPTLLSSGTTVAGTLLLANCTPAGGVVSQFPPGAGASAKDVWYSYATAASGPVTIDTCYALPSGCPQSDLVIAVYKMNGILVPVSGSWFSQPINCLNPKGVQVQFNAQACKTYFIRVSGKSAGTLPGEFALRLTDPNAAPQNNACLSAVPVGPNSSNPFNTTTATTDGPASEPVFNDIWYSFQWPAGPGGPYGTVVETCSSSFNTALAVYAVGGPCPGAVVPLASDSTCPTHAKSFLANAGQQYLIRVGGATVNDKGCGSLHVTSGLPLAGTSPQSSGNSHCKRYRIQGLPTGVGWTWNLSAPAALPCLGFNVTDTVAPYPASPLTALHIAQVFAASITRPGFTATAINLGSSSIADLKICFNCQLASQVALHVNGCWVDNSSCSFNPDISDLDDSNNPDLDCNGNGQSDYLDILDGTSTDVDGNGVPDECQGCVQVALADGPQSTSGGVGGSVSFVATAVGSGPFSYQWRKGGLALTGETNASLVLRDLTLSAADLYDVIVSNSCSQVTSPAAALYVDPRPVLNITRIGSNVRLSWSPTDYHLQANPALDNPAGWSDIAGPSPLTIPLSNTVRYFRLLRAP